MNKSLAFLLMLTLFAQPASATSSKCPPCIVLGITYGEALFLTGTFALGATATIVYFRQAQVEENDAPPWDWWIPENQNEPTPPNNWNPFQPGPVDWTAVGVTITAFAAKVAPEVDEWFKNVQRYGWGKYLGSDKSPRTIIKTSETTYVVTDGVKWIQINTTSPDGTLPTEITPAPSHKQVKEWMEYAQTSSPVWKEAIKSMQNRWNRVQLAIESGKVPDSNDVARLLEFAPGLCFNDPNCLRIQNPLLEQIAQAQKVLARVSEMTISDSLFLAPDWLKERIDPSVFPALQNYTIEELNKMESGELLNLFKTTADRNLKKLIFYILQSRGFHEWFGLLPTGDYELIIYTNGDGEIFPWIRWLGPGEPTDHITGVYIDAVIRFSIVDGHTKLQIHCMFPNDLFLTFQEYADYFLRIQLLFEEYYGFQIWTAWRPWQPVTLCHRAAQVRQRRE